MNRKFCQGIGGVLGEQRCGGEVRKRDGADRCGVIVGPDRARRSYGVIVLFFILVFDCS